jgi:hypothetical protein
VEADDMHAILRKVKKRFETNKEKLSIIKSWRSNKLRARSRPVVVMRLQAQHIPSRLCTSSNTLSVQKNVINGTSLLISNDGDVLSTLQIFVLRSTWVNRHNLR